MILNRKIYRQLSLVCLVTAFAFTAFISYRDNLNCYFMATDSLALIDTGRIQNISDIFRIVSEPLMNGTRFTDTALYYRPVTSFSCGLNYLLCGLQPFCFHLTNILLHASVTILIFFLAYKLGGKNTLTASISAICFSLHPILVENVPATARRHDILMSLFMLLSIFYYIRFSEQKLKKRVPLFMSLLFFILAFGAKEIGIIIPVILLVYSLLHYPENLHKNRILNAFRQTFWHFFFAVLFFLWRLFVLKSIGGYINESVREFNPIIGFYQMILFYFQDLFYPVAFLKTIPAARLYMLIIFLAGVVIYRGIIYKCIIRNHGTLLKIATYFVSGIFLITSILFIVKPYMVLLITQLVTEAYSGNGAPGLQLFMESQHVLPLEYYITKSHSVFESVVSWTLMGSITILIIILVCRFSSGKSNKIWKYSSINTELFLIFWLCIPLGIYYFTQHFSHRNMYGSVIPFSILISIVFEKCLAGIRNSIYPKFELLRFFRRIVPLGLMSGLIISLLAYSPLLQTYDEWEESALISEMFFEELSILVPQLPVDSELQLLELPLGISSYKSIVPRVREVSYLGDHSIKSWLDMNYPLNRMKIKIVSRKTMVKSPVSIRFEVKTLANSATQITVIPGTSDIPVQ